MRIRVSDRIVGIKSYRLFANCSKFSALSSNSRLSLSRLRINVSSSLCRSRLIPDCNFNIFSNLGEGVGWEREGGGVREKGRKGGREEAGY